MIIWGQWNTEKLQNHFKVLYLMALFIFGNHRLIDIRHQQWEHKTLSERETIPLKVIRHQLIASHTSYICILYVLAKYKKLQYQIALCHSPFDFCSRHNMDKILSMGVFLFLLLFMAIPQNTNAYEVRLHVECF